jgi:hypothetical protein
MAGMSVPFHNEKKRHACNVACFLFDYLPRYIVRAYLRCRASWRVRAILVFVFLILGFYIYLSLERVAFHFAQGFDHFSVAHDVYNWKSFARVLCYEQCGESYAAFIL